MIADNLIVIKGGSYIDVKKALKQWINLYSKDLQDGLAFQLYKNGRGNHIIQADKKLDNERFYYLINYLNYPEGIEYKIEIEGFTTGKENNKLQGQNLLVYISPDDKDYDNVFVTTSENENFKVDFGGRIIETNESKIFQLPNDIIFDSPETIVVEQKQSIRTQIESESTENQLKKRFTIISTILISAFALTYLILKDDESFFIINYIIAFVVWGWLFIDYKILQIDKLYYRAVLLGILILGCRYLPDSYNNHPLFLTGTSMPLLLLIIQRPMRFVFKHLMKREPVVEKPAPSFADFIYIITLCMTVVLPTLYYAR